ncbi:DUF4325 domain-containing protein [Vibrio splendidus]|jgi:hypothetical protein
MSENVLRVTDYTREPFGRYIDDGDGNGEEFRTQYIVPRLKLLEGSEVLVIDLDGVEDGYGSSFVVEAFANLIREEGYTYEYLTLNLDFRSTHKEWIKEINDYMLEANLEVSRKLLTND